MTSNWATTKVALPDAVVQISTSLDSLLDVLLAVLHIAQAILETVKTFIVGLLDPIQVIVNQIIADIEGLFQDLRNIGVYITGDFDVPYPYTDLKGGYSAYERRVISRLVDRTDPTRPAFSDATQVFAVFLYNGVETAGIASITNFLNKLSRFFGIGTTQQRAPGTIPVPLPVLYGSTYSSVGMWSALETATEPPTVANLRWSMSAPGGTFNAPLPAPAGFLVEVSTEREGLPIAYDIPALNASKEENRQTGLFVRPEGSPFRLYGEGIEDNSWTYQGAGVYAPPDNAGKQITYAYRNAANNTPIPIRALTTPEGKSLLVRTFFYPTTFLGTLIQAGQPFSYKLRYEDLPYDADFELLPDGSVKATPTKEPARTVYARVLPVSKNVTETNPFKWTVTSESLSRAQQSGYAVMDANMEMSDRGLESVPITVTFPSSDIQDYVDVIATALVILTLSRSDLQAVSEYRLDAGAEATGLETYAAYLSVVPDSKYFKSENVSPIQFRNFIRVRAQKLANEIFQRTGPSSATFMAMVLKTCFLPSLNKRLDQVQWADLIVGGSSMTILGSLSDSDMSVGVGLNPLSIGNPQAKVVRALMASGARRVVRAPGFWDRNPLGFMGTGSCDYSPVYYTGESIQFCRNVFLQNKELLEVTGQVLNLTTATLSSPTPSGGAWISYKLFPTGLPSLEGLLEQIEAFLRGLSSGLTDLTDRIVAYINFLELRIQEIEGLLQRIDSLLNYLLTIDIPAVSGLVVEAAGMDGVLESFATATNKPFDSDSAYGGGMVLVSGGMPQALVDMLGLFFPQSG